MSGRVTAPELEQFVVNDVQLTGVTLGAGAYGSVEEVEIPGARVAAKKLHPQLINLGSPEQKLQSKWISDYVKECKLMSQLRHPHIVQFLGVCYLPGSPLPVLLMEKLLTSLHNLLETSPNISLDVKVHLLTGTAQGIVYLHSRTPPIAHRDLTARNILIDSGLIAKIADLGVARIVNIQPGELAATMTEVPGNYLYMPPEAVHEEGATRYNTAIDIFSFGVVSLFTLTQTFPKDLKSATYRDSATRTLTARTEIERRDNYVRLMRIACGETHSLVKLTLDCLEYDPEDRPSAVEVLRGLEEAGRTIPQNYNNKTKLELIQQISRKEEDIKRDHREQMKQKQCQMEELQAAINLLQVTLDQKQAQIDSLETEKQEQAHRYEEKAILQQQQLENQRREIEQLSDQLHELHPQEEGSQTTQLKKGGWLMVRASITFDWIRCQDRSHDSKLFGQPVAHNGKLYIRGFTRGLSTVLEYTPDCDQWTELPPPPVGQFTIATLKGQLLLVGGENSDYKATNTIFTFDESSQQWQYSYPLLPTALTNPAAISYQDDLIVAGGCNSKNNRVTEVYIFNATRKMWPWVRAYALPSTDDYHTVSIEDTLYLVGQDTKVVHVLEAQVPTLISGTKWNSLPNAVDYHSCPTAISNTLLTVGGSRDKYGSHPTTAIHMYDSTHNQWTRVGDLPEPMSECHCTVFSGKLFVLGGSGTRSVYVSTVYH